MCLGIAMQHPEAVLATGKHAGYEWQVIHNSMGFRCGYIKVELGHPWHGKPYDDIDASVHGGLTFGSMDTPCDKKGPDNGYWVGFDCAHSGDAPDPKLPAGSSFGFLGGSSGSIKTQRYVEAECRRLCEQAQAAA